MGEGWIGEWSPGLGDDSFMGWLTVLAYFLAAWLCWRSRRAAIGSYRPGARRSALLWTAFAVGLVLLGINKQLDLQTALTEVGRVLSYRHGWYDQRRLVQLAFIGTVAALSAVLLAALVVAARHELGRMLIALLGVAELGCFVLIRASSFHHVDRFIGSSIGGIRMNWVMELGGIVLIMIGAVLYSRGEAVVRRP